MRAMDILARTATLSRAHAAALLVLTLWGAGCSGARMASNEASAIASVRTVVSAQAVYGALCGGSYAPTLPGLLARGYLPADLGGTDTPSKLGYRFRMSTVKGTGVTECGDAYTDYEIRAEPEVPGSTGTRYFRATSSGEVFAATKPDFSDATPLP
jgi:hypothetical protein